MNIEIRNQKVLYFTIQASSLFIFLIPHFLYSLSFSLLPSGEVGWGFTPAATTRMDILWLCAETCNAKTVLSSVRPGQFLQQLN